MCNSWSFFNFIRCPRTNNVCFEISPTDLGKSETGLSPNNVHYKHTNNRKKSLILGFFNRIFSKKNIFIENVLARIKKLIYVRKYQRYFNDILYSSCVKYLNTRNIVVKKIKKRSR